MLHDEATRFANWFPMFNDEAKQHLMVEAESNLSEGVSDLFHQHLQNCNAQSRLERMLYLDCKLWLADYLLLRGDKLTMANSLEARVPLLDHRVVEFAACLPESMKLRGSQRKYLLRKAACRLLPADIIHRKKQGFPIPIDRWLRREAEPLLRDLLNEQTLKQRGYFEPKFVDQMIKQHVAGLANHSTELWGLISLEMWMQKFIDSPAVLSPSSFQSSTLTPLVAEPNVPAGDCI
jgi:asparagine synthase (glutamine-hydrolysing)